MFAVETLPPQYYEERAAAETARRLAEQRKLAATEAELKTATAAQQSITPSEALYQPPPPPLIRPGSSTVLGSIFQNLLKSAPSTPSATPARVDTPDVATSDERAGGDAGNLIAKLRREDELKRDLDIVG